jgi:hypothetical protein
MAFWNGTKWVRNEPAHSPQPRRRHRLWGAAAEASLITLLIFGLIASTALAARGGNGGKGPGKPGGGSGTISLVMVSDANANGAPNYADTITFNVSTDATNEPYVSVSCSQGGSVVYGGSAGFFDGYPWPWNQNFALYSSYWTGGAADCAAELYLHDGRQFKTLATMAFHVDA